MNDIIKYNVAILDAKDGATLLGELDKYGLYGWTFVGWAETFEPVSEKYPWLKQAIFIVP